ncbi:MAG: hypothetical protein QF805_16285 [Pirellulaceae bacterium]|jgi:hypothetical protein|nr:hypothetical protein [Pirellulaceae bacterium]
MNEDGGLIRRVDWRELIPWLILGRVFGVATRLPVLLLALLTATTAPLGWRLSEILFLDQNQQLAMGSVLAERNALPGVRSGHELPLKPSQMARKAVGYIDVAGASTLRPALAFARYANDLTSLAYFAFGCLWTLIVFGIGGGAITRIAVVQLGREERVGVRSAVAFATKRLTALVGAPLMPLGAVAFFTFLTLLVGLGTRLGEPGVAVAGVMWIFSAIGGSMSVVLLIGVVFGWPLMTATICAERSGDSFEAISRAYAYIFQRPFRVIFYVVIACLIGGVGWVLVDAFAEAVIYICFWNADWGDAGNTVMDWRVGVESATNSGLNDGFGTAAITATVYFVRGLADAYHYSFFWASAAAIYLLLRRDVDEAEMEEVFVEGEENAYGLPPVVQDDAQIPHVDQEQLNETPADQAATETDPADQSDSAGDDQSTANEPGESREENPEASDAPADEPPTEPDDDGRES